jgi:hypothetical protein
MTLEVEARVCGWPHAATMGALGMLHTIVKRDLDINMYGCPLVQARISFSPSLYHSFAPSIFIHLLGCVHAGHHHAKVALTRSLSFVD